MVRLFSKLTLFLILCSCTGKSGDSPSVIGSITDSVKETIGDIISPDPSINKAEKQISEIQNDLNKDNTYALTQDDVAMLKSEGLAVNEDEIKSWVK